MSSIKSSLCNFLLVSLFSAVIVGCVSFEPVLFSEVEHFEERPFVAILPFTFDLPITSLATLKSIDHPLSPEEESVQVQEVLDEIQQTARSLLLSRLAPGGGFRFVPIDQIDMLMEELHMTDRELPTAEQLAIFRSRLGTDLVVAGNILDYGKIRPANQFAIKNQLHQGRLNGMENATPES